MFSNRVSLNHATQTMDTNPIKTAITVCSELIQKQVKRCRVPRRASQVKRWSEAMGFLQTFQQKWSCFIILCKLLLVQYKKITFYEKWSCFQFLCKHKIVLTPVYMIFKYSKRFSKMEQKVTNCFANFYLCSIRKKHPKNGAKLTKFFANFYLCSIRKNPTKNGAKSHEIFCKHKIFFLGIHDFQIQ